MLRLKSINEWLNVTVRLPVRIPLALPVVPDIRKLWYELLAKAAPCHREMLRLIRPRAAAANVQPPYYQAARWGPTWAAGARRAARCGRYRTNSGTGSDVCAPCVQIAPNAPEFPRIAHSYA